jgi:hypothetical protein
MRKPAVTLLVCLLTGVASAQTPGGPSGTSSSASPSSGQAMPLPGPIFPNGAGYYPDYMHHASTIAEGVGRGLGDLTRAQGDYNLHTSQAAVNWSQAYRYGLDNAQKTIDTYFDLRKMNEAYRAAQRGKRPTREDMARYAKLGVPHRLSPGELDSTTGWIAWPVLLRSPQFAAYRAGLEKLFADRGTGEQLSAEDYLKIHQATKAMSGDLQKNVAKLPPVDYLVAKRFLASLAFEARLPVDNSVRLGMAK